MNFAWFSKVSDKGFMGILLLVVFAASVMSFVSNWLMLLNSGEILGAYKLFEISFFYFTPVVSWSVVIYFMVKRFSKNFNKKDILNKAVLTILFVAILAFAMRLVDILLDFSIKYLIGMVNVSPIRILNEVWLVVLATTPKNIVLLSIFVVIIFLRNEEQRKERVIQAFKGRARINVPLNEITHIQSKGNYLIIHAQGGQYKLRGSMGKILNYLTDDFLQIHRSTIINKSGVRSIEHWRNGEYLVCMYGGYHLTSSRTYTANVHSLKQAVPL